MAGMLPSATTSMARIWQPIDTAQAGQADVADDDHRRPETDAWARGRRCPSLTSKPARAAPGGTDEHVRSSSTSSTRMGNAAHGGLLLPSEDRRESGPPRRLRLGACPHTRTSWRNHQPEAQPGQPACSRQGSNRRGRMSARMPGPVSQRSDDPAAIGAGARATCCGAPVASIVRIRRSARWPWRPRRPSLNSGRLHVGNEVDVVGLSPATTPPVHRRCCAPATRGRRRIALVRKVLSCEAAARRSTMPDAAGCAHLPDAAVEQIPALWDRVRSRQGLIQL
jgi:hypothetical protein